ncbi:MAG: hypothetical protein EPN22_08865 [Nitrospirae bacterium]|nr:MAG: hypothetical protein EPN22_08865 [Nitrospirota bacterium]
MTVLVEGISAIIRRKSIDDKFMNGWEGFQEFVPNNTLCFDDDLAMVGFMSPQDVQGFVYQLQERGLTFLKNNKAVDIAVVDQQRGVTTECAWLMFSHLNINSASDKVDVCWLVSEERIQTAGIHMPSNWQAGESIKLATPSGWTYENSLSQKFKFVENENLNKDMIFLGREDGMYVYLDLTTGKKLYEGRTSKE